MFIVKLILVPLWPFFIANWSMKKAGEFSIKGYLATVVFGYGFLLIAAYGVLTLFTGGRPEPTNSTAPSAETAPAASEAK